MRALVFGVAALALLAGATSAQQAVYPRYGYARFGYGYAHGYHHRYYANYPRYHHHRYRYRY